MNEGDGTGLIDHQPHYNEEEKTGKPQGEYRNEMISEQKNENVVGY